MSCKSRTARNSDDGRSISIVFLRPSTQSSEPGSSILQKRGPGNIYMARCGVIPCLNVSGWVLRIRCLGTRLACNRLPENSSELRAKGEYTLFSTTSRQCGSLCSIGTHSSTSPGLFPVGTEHLLDIHRRRLESGSPGASILHATYASMRGMMKLSASRYLADVTHANTYTSKYGGITYDPAGRRERAKAINYKRKTHLSSGLLQADIIGRWSPSKPS